MKDLLIQFVQKTANFFGYTINYLDPVMERDEVFLKIFQKCAPYTLTSRKRMYALYQSVKYVVEAGIRGAFVECGVWRGGSAMLIALTLLELNESDRKIYLYDTFKGMTAPTDEDHQVSNKKVRAIDQWKRGQLKDRNQWCYVPLTKVKRNMTRTSYPSENLKFVQGPVEETIPETVPPEISVLRLDTDWYVSTRHELIHLYPLLSNKGVLIIDDYGAWAGSKKAVDEYFHKRPILLNRIDNYGRIGVKID